MSSSPIRLWDIRRRWNVSRIEFFPGWNELCRASLSRATPFGFLKRTCGALPYPDSLREKHTTLVNITLRTIAYPIRMCCPDHWLNVSKPCYVIRTACHRPCTAAIRWCVRTPCPDIFCSLHSGFAYGKGLQSSGSSCFWAFHCFAMDSKELSSISDCFGDQKAIKTPKLNTIWLELIARVLNMLIGLKCDNYYSKVFIRVNYKLWNSTFWVVITVLDQKTFISFIVH